MKPAKCAIPRWPIHLWHSSNMSRRSTTISFIAVATLITGIAPPAAHASLGRVINGTPNPPHANAAVFLDGPDAYCSGTLVLPNLIATAAHCFIEGGAQTSSPTDWRVYAPGVDVGASDPSPVHPTALVVDPAYYGLAEADRTAVDIAYLVLDGALGAPAISRIATPDEIIQLAAQRATLEQVGYGQTVPRSVKDAPSSNVPLGTSAPLDPFTQKSAHATVTTNGTTGTCAGDSGSPYLGTLARELLLVGVLSSGNNPPCEDDSGSNDFLAVPGLHPDLLAQAIAAAGSVPAAQPRTCIKVGRDSAECTDTRSWTFRYCWEAPTYVIQQRVGAGWATLASGRARKAKGCRGRWPYSVDVTMFVEPGEYRYRINAPKLPGAKRANSYPFTVTSS